MQVEAASRTRVTGAEEAGGPLIPADAVLAPPELEDVLCLPQVSGGAPAPTAQDIDDAVGYPGPRRVRHRPDRRGCQKNPPSEVILVSTSH